MTLIGLLTPASEEFDNLNTVEWVEADAAGVRITGDKTLFCLSRVAIRSRFWVKTGDWLALTRPGNACPTVISGGDLTICGSGVSNCRHWSTQLLWARKRAKFPSKNCLTSVFKSDKLGFDGRILRKRRRPDHDERDLLRLDRQR